MSFHHVSFTSSSSLVNEDGNDNQAQPIDSVVSPEIITEQTLVILGNRQRQLQKLDLRRVRKIASLCQKHTSKAKKIDPKDKRHEYYQKFIMGEFRRHLKIANSNKYDKKQRLRSLEAVQTFFKAMDLVANEAKAVIGDESSATETQNKRSSEDKSSKETAQPVSEGHVHTNHLSTSTVSPIGDEEATGDIILDLKNNQVSTNLNAKSLKKHPPSSGMPSSASPPEAISDNSSISFIAQLQKCVASKAASENVSNQKTAVPDTLNKKMASNQDNTNATTAPTDIAGEKVTSTSIAPDQPAETSSLASSIKTAMQKCVNKLQEDSCVRQRAAVSKNINTGFVAYAGQSSGFRSPLGSSLEDSVGNVPQRDTAVDRPITDGRNNTSSSAFASQTSTNLSSLHTSLQDNSNNVHHDNSTAFPNSSSSQYMNLITPAGPTDGNSFALSISMQKNTDKMQHDNMNAVDNEVMKLSTATSNNSGDRSRLPPIYSSDFYLPIAFDIERRQLQSHYFSDMIGAERPPYQASLEGRPACTLRYSTSVPHISLYESLMRNDTLNERFSRWDPFYKCLHDVVHFAKDRKTNQVVKVRYVDSKNNNNELRSPFLFTSVVEKATCTNRLREEARPLSCLVVSIQIPAYVSKLVTNWGYETGDSTADETMLICRMLPIDSMAMKNDLADTHLWPKGTFMEINGKPVSLVQRRQQSHDPRQWKGMCKLLDMTPLINAPTAVNQIKLVTREHACYAMQVCIAERRSSKTVFQEALEKTNVIPFDLALEKAKNYVKNQTISLDDDVSSKSDTRQSHEEEENNHLSFKLLCPISMTPIREPVRGKHCRHFQCFDLLNFIESNSFPSGRRWKCPCCDKFVSLDSLEICGFFKDILEKNKAEISSDGKDSVWIYSNGRWNVVSSKKRRGASDLPQRRDLKLRSVGKNYISDTTTVPTDIAGEKVTSTSIAPDQPAETSSLASSLKTAMQKCVNKLQEDSCVRQRAAVSKNINTGFVAYAGQSSGFRSPLGSSLEDSVGNVQQRDTAVDRPITDGRNNTSSSAFASQTSTNLSSLHTSLQDNSNNVHHDNSTAFPNSSSSQYMNLITPAGPTDGNSFALSISMQKNTDKMQHDNMNAVDNEVMKLSTATSNNSGDRSRLPPIYSSDFYLPIAFDIERRQLQSHYFSDMIGAERPPYQASLEGRPACTLRYSTSVPHISLYESLMRNDTLNERFSRWDPFYKCLHDVVHFAKDRKTNQVVKVRYVDSKNNNNELRSPFLFTSVVEKATCTNRLREEARPLSCLVVSIQIPAYVSKLVTNWGYETGDSTADETMLICRMLPIDSMAMKNDLADTHLWPKGTFMEINGKPVSLVQRRQQSHDPRQWKGMCKLLDMTPLINAPTAVNQIKLVTREHACYAMQVCIAERRSSKTVFQEALEKTNVIPFDLALEKAKNYVKNQTISLDDDVSSKSDTRQSHEEEENNHLSFKLLCPISMTPIREPVRGKHCRHFQCFDLLNFIESNSFPSGRRWKCPCCDKFVSLDSLEICGFFKDILGKNKAEISSDGKDSVWIYSNGRWNVVSSKKRRGASDLPPRHVVKRSKAVLDVLVID